MMSGWRELIREAFFLEVLKPTQNSRKVPASSAYMAEPAKCAHCDVFTDLSDIHKVWMPETRMIAARRCSLM